MFDLNQERRIVLAKQSANGVWQNEMEYWICQTENAAEQAAVTNLSEDEITKFADRSRNASECAAYCRKRLIS